MMISTSTRLVTRSMGAPSPCNVCRVHRRSAHKLVQIELLSDIPSLGLRGTRLPVSRGLARNRLIPSGQALLIGTDNEPVSAVNAMSRKMLQLEGRFKSLGERRIEEERLLREKRAKDVLDGLSKSVEDPLISAEQSLLSQLSTIPQPLPFHRLTTSPTSTDLFGSVSVSDVINQLRELNVKVEESLSAFREGDGIENGRVKKTGTFDFLISFKTLDQVYPLQVKVTRE